MLKVGIVSSFHPHGIAKKLRGLRQKLDALHVQTGLSRLLTREESDDGEADHMLEWDLRV